MYFIRKIYYVIIELLMLLKIIILSVTYKKRVYVFGTPVHGNIGDHAIFIATKQFIKDNFPELKAIEVESKIVIKFTKTLIKIVKNSTIFINGGGFLGSLWMNEEEMFRTTLKNFSNNKIIVFPQTIYFSNDKSGMKILKESKKIYSSHKNLFICCREQYSYDFMKKEMPSCNILLIPDMVLYLEIIKNAYARDNILFCIRNDKEKVKYNFDEIVDKLQRKYKIDYTDTIVQKNIFPYNRKRFLNDKLKQFSKYKLVVTDRLHGMIFALLSQTPCIALQNVSCKVKGVYEWIKNVNYIKVCDIEEIDDVILERMLNIKEYNYKRETILEEYKDLIKIINME